MKGGHPSDDWDWTPAKGAPGELFTPESQVKATGAFWRNLLQRTRTTPEQQSMLRIGTYLVVGIVGFIVLAAVVAAVL